VPVEPTVARDVSSGCPEYVDNAVSLDGDEMSTAELSATLTKSRRGRVVLCGRRQGAGPLTSECRPVSQAPLFAISWLDEDAGRFFFLPLMNWMSISEPFTRTSSQRR
jgi:hypothetical protein